MPAGRDDTLNGPDRMFDVRYRAGGRVLDPLFDLVVHAWSLPRNLNVPREPPHDPLEFLGRHRPTGPFAPLFLGAGDELGARSLPEPPAALAAVIGGWLAQVHPRRLT